MVFSKPRDRVARRLFKRARTQPQLALRLFRVERLPEAQRLDILRQRQAKPVARAMSASTSLRGIFHRGGATPAARAAMVSPSFSVRLCPPRMYRWPTRPRSAAAMCASATSRPSTAFDRRLKVEWNLSLGHAEQQLARRRLDVARAEHRRRVEDDDGQSFGGGAKGFHLHRELGFIIRAAGCAGYIEIALVGQATGLARRADRRQRAGVDQAASRQHRLRPPTPLASASRCDAPIRRCHARRADKPPPRGTRRRSRASPRAGFGLLASCAKGSSP